MFHYAEYFVLLKMTVVWEVVLFSLVENYGRQSTSRILSPFFLVTKSIIKMKVKNNFISCFRWCYAWSLYT